MLVQKIHAVSWLRMTLMQMTSVQSAFLAMSELALLHVNKVRAYGLDYQQIIERISSWAAESKKNVLALSSHAKVECGTDGALDQFVDPHTRVVETGKLTACR